MNRFITTGYLGADPELKYTTNSVPFVTLSLGQTERWTDAQGVKTAT